MAHYSPEEAFESLKKRTAQTIQGYFPIEGKQHTLTAKRVWVDDNKSLDDIREQRDARIKGRSWTVPIRAELELRDNISGKLLDKQVVNVAQLPKITRRYSYIVDGSEWQVNNLFRMKPGVYTRVRRNGELTSQWNLAKGQNFHMDFSPKTQKMSLRYGEAQIPLYPILKTMGIDDDSIERAWGKDILSANKVSGDENALRKFYRAVRGSNPETVDMARNLVHEEFNRTVLRPDSTKLTLGKPYDKVTGDSLLSGSHKILQVSRQEVEPDDRDSLPFKELHSAEDLINERLEKWQVEKGVKRKLGNTIDKNEKVRDVINPDIFGKPLRKFFVSSVLSERPSQTNPVSFIAGNRRTTLFAPGEGGIKSSHEVTLEAQSINPSHLGFLDPIQTPESERIGVTLQLASHVVKDGHDIKIPVFNTKTGKRELINPYQALKSNLAFPDQYEMKSGKPVPIKSTVKVSDPEGTVTVVKPGDVDYILSSSKGMFDLSANLIPFLQNNQGNRTMVASRQLEQAVSLKHREEPLVQTRSDRPSRTFEQGLGEFVSHASPVSGTVDAIKKDAIIIKAKGGTKHEIQLYDDYPLNDDKSVLNSTPLVRVGDSVSVGQIVADTNFTKGGTLALGTNLKVAYMPWKGLNFEDGVVVSESAAKKLTSEHLFRESVSAEKNVQLDKKKFLSYMAGKVTKEQSDKLDDNAVVREGQTVNKDDILVGVLKEETVTPDEQKLGLFSKGLIRPWKPREVRWTKDVPGVVTRVAKHGKNTTVYVRAEVPADVGDKIVGRHGNKGVVTAVLPDHEMPQDKDGKAVEVLLNQTGVPTRINLGQVLETAAAKIAEKTGKPYVVNNFDPKTPDYTRSLMEELKKHGISDTEDLKDPVTNRMFSRVLTGPQYILKLHHTADKGLSVRSRDAYDSNMLPSGGGPKGGQTMDAMGMYALLAHNARENIREMQTLKSDFNDEFWTQLQAGDSIPTPKIPFVFKKFEGYLKGMGLDVRKEGNNLILQPLTDKKVLELSNGALADAGRALWAKDAKEEAGGIFDPKVTGGVKGKKWSHIPLPERMPNPVFEGPISSLLGLNQNSFDRVVKGEEPFNGGTGPQAIVAAIKALDTKKMRKEIETELPSLRATKLNNANKKLKYLRALERSGLSPSEAYTMKHLPVLPPVFRPIVIMDNGVIRYDDVNRLYNHIGHVNLKLKGFDEALPPEEKTELQSALYDGLKAVMLTGGVHQGRHRNSIMQTISGSSGEGGQPKEGFFQDKIIGRRQDLSMRGVITPEPSLSLDEVGLPRKAAAELYKPFVVRRLVQMGQKPLDAQEMVKKNHPAALEALQAVVSERPIIMKRDPVLHKFGVQAFLPKLIEGKAIQVHPLVTSGFNADFDGDKMSAFVPVSQKAVKEAFKMLPSFNLFSPTTGYLMSKPTQESMMGLYKLTEVEKKEPIRFASVADAARAVKEGKIQLTDPVLLKDIESDPFGELFKKAAPPVKTTVGRVLLYQSLPSEIRDQKILTDTSFMFNKKNLNDLLSSVAKQTPKDFGIVADRLKDIGNEYATGMSIGLEDFLSDHSHRDEVLKDAAKKESQIRSRTSSPVKRKEEIVKLYSSAAEKIHNTAKKNADQSRNRMYDWVKSGARGSWSQFKQITVAPMLVADSRGEPVPIPIPKSYSEGLDIGSYFASMHGARMGTIGRVQGTQAPGKMSKQLINTTMNQLIVDEDCGTTKGIVLPIDNRDVLGRFTVKDIDLGTKGGVDKGKIPSGTLVTPDLLNRLKNNKVSTLEVRSPLRCAHGSGLCSKCYGLNEEGNLHSPGANVGVIAAQALGEPATQLAMNCLSKDTVVRVRNTDGEVFLLTLEQLWEKTAIPASVENGVETKVFYKMEVWDTDRFTTAYTIQRHKPTDSMYVMETRVGKLVSQGNHPNWGRLSVASCRKCGSRRPLKLVRGADSGTDGRKVVWVRCRDCGKLFDMPSIDFLNQEESVFHTRAIEERYVSVTTEWQPSSKQSFLSKLFQVAEKLFGASESKVDYLKVNCVKEVDYDDWTYDLSTATRAFSANRIRTHNSFHTGGIVGAKGTSATSLFNRLEQLLNVPKKLPGAATLSDASGIVSKIEKDPAGGWRVVVAPHDAPSSVGPIPHYVPASRTLAVKKGDEVRSGDSLSDGPKNPRDMLVRTNMNTVQKYLTDEIWNAYKDEGPVRRRNVETFVRAMTNLSEVVDPGDHDTLLRGDHAPTSEVTAFNRGLKPGQRQVTFKPILQGVNMLPLELQTDWIARLQSRGLKDTILDAAAEGWRSVLHGTHPIPGMAVGKEFGQGTEKEPWLY